MKIEKNRVVSFHYRLSGVGGEELEASAENEPVLYLHGHGNILLALEQEMEGREAGEEFSITVPPEKAYGLKKPDAEQRVPVKHLVGVRKNARLKKGQMVGINTEKGVVNARIIKAGKFAVDVDTNHPLAGMELTFHIRIEDVREASEEETAHGHAHGPGGHHH